VTVEREPVSGQGYIPEHVGESSFPRVPASLLAELRGLAGLSPIVSDALDELGWKLTVPAGSLPRRSGVGTVVGQAITIRYLPERLALHSPGRLHLPSRLAHRHLFSTGRPGDVAVFDVGTHVDHSVLGGLAAAEAAGIGLMAVVVDGAVRDLEEVRRSGISVWSRGVTAITGKWRLEAVSINFPVACGGVQVHAGDLVIADDSGLCFVPVDKVDSVVAVVREIVSHETAGLAKSPNISGAVREE
jgi:4-hydroxy-4-methyl-2-oxoglutarate aldolase